MWCLCFYYCYDDHRDLHILTHSFPTRRSSDLATDPGRNVRLADGLAASAGDVVITRRNDRRLRTRKGSWVRNGDRWTLVKVRMDGRSEEHTSELQSLMRISYAVFCLKQKNKVIIFIYYPYCTYT